MTPKQAKAEVIAKIRQAGKTPYKDITEKEIQQLTEALMKEKGKTK